MGADKFEKLGIVVGKSYNISFDVESREWNGKYFTDITAWKAVCVDGGNAPQQASSNVQNQQPQAAQQAPTSANDDGLPFWCVFRSRKQMIMNAKHNENLQAMCRDYLTRLRYMAKKHGIDVDSIIKLNKRGECSATNKEVEMLSRCVDDERVSRADIPKILGKSYRQSNEEGDFERIKKLKRVGIYSKVSALLYKSKRNERAEKWSF